jgi:hypothetical protein
VIEKSGAATARRIKSYIMTKNCKNIVCVNFQLSQLHFQPSKKQTEFFCEFSSSILPLYGHNVIPILIRFKKLRSILVDLTFIMQEKKLLEFWVCSGQMFK